MVQNVQELINKIKHEGLEAGQENARRIEVEAKEKSETVIAAARKEAEAIIAEARAKQKQLEDSTKASLQQAARDTVLTLKKRINDLLCGIIKKEVGASLDHERMSALIITLAKQYMQQNSEARSVQVGLSDKDRQALEESLTAQLKQELKAGVTVRTADDLTGGFTVSFDEGKSNFDFSEQSLVDYLKKYVNDYVAGLLKG